FPPVAVVRLSGGHMVAAPRQVVRSQSADEGAIPCGRLQHPQAGPATCQGSHPVKARLDEVWWRVEAPPELVGSQQVSSLQGTPFRAEDRSTSTARAYRV